MLKFLNSNPVPPVILATQEAETRRISIQGKPVQIVIKIPNPK
jgi:hypothetical protein